MSHCQDDWADWLPLAEFAYNNHVHSATHHTLFELDSGQHPQMGSEPTQSSAVEAADNFAQQMSQMQDKVKAALEHTADEMAQYYDCQRSPTPTYKVGAKVWLNAVSGRTVSWGLELLRYPLCLQGSDTEEKGVPVKCN